MTIKNSRTGENGRVTVDFRKCVLCGACVSVCKGDSLRLESGRVKQNPQSHLGCIACGQCAAVCPAQAIRVEGRGLSPEDIVPLPPVPARAGYPELQALMLSRRSVRDFLESDVEQEKIDQILTTATTAPMGIPPTDVAAMVLKGRDKVREFSFDLLKVMKDARGFFSPPALFLMRPFIGKENHEFFKNFIARLVGFLVRHADRGEDMLLYDAPLAIYFYGSPYSGLADPVIAATYATLAAESLGLGSCLIGSVSPFLKKGGKAVKQKYGIPSRAGDGIMVVFGYPKFPYHRAVKRTLRGVTYP